METEEKIRILTEGAKYDVSCSSSGSSRKAAKGGIGDTAACGICHSFTSDGRCISILKILASNKCEFDCAYCVNRRTLDVPRASLTAEEICALTMGFYRRNFIEGLFLSSAVETSPDFTMQKLSETAMLLRTKYKFGGYIHLKAIPGASPNIIDEAAKYADRMSVNIELPSENSLKLLAPQKRKEMIVKPMNRITALSKTGVLPAGQTTQMIIGASPEPDGRIIRLTEALYRRYGLKRVYYSAFIPAAPDSRLPAVPTDLRRENRLYQADWLLRFYGFDAGELLTEGENLPLEIDPKLNWAIKHPEKFPLEVNAAEYADLLRVPGIGPISAWRITRARRHGKLDFDALKKMRVVLKSAKFFITAGGKRLEGFDKTKILAANSLSGEQISMFGQGTLTGGGKLLIGGGDENNFM